MTSAVRWWIGVAILWHTALPAQPTTSIGFLHGELLGWSYGGSPHAGELTIRDSDNAVYTCQFDNRTYFEREHQAIAARGLAGAAAVEVVADRNPGSASCYARTVQVVDGIRPPGRPSSPTETFAPRGDFSFGGVVVCKEFKRFVVRTRAGEIRVAVRADTHYLGDGIRLDASNLAVNTHVFVRAGYGLDDHLEAYQVIWGEITAAR